MFKTRFLGLFFVFISVFILSCGPHTDFRINPYFQQFIIRFKNDSNLYGTSTGSFDAITIIDFKNDLGSKEANAQCRRVKDDDSDYFNEIPAHKEVYFSHTILNQPIEYQYFVFLHEMGHCSYHLQHSTDPTQIMYEEAPMPTSNSEKIQLRHFFDSAIANQSDWYSFDPI